MSEWQFGTIIRGNSDPFTPETVVMLVSRNVTTSSFTAEDRYVVSPGDWCGYALAGDGGAYPTDSTVWVSASGHGWETVE